MQISKFEIEKKPDRVQNSWNTLLFSLDSADSFFYILRDIASNMRKSTREIKKPELFIHIQSSSRKKQFFGNDDDGEDENESVGDISDDEDFFTADRKKSPKKRKATRPAQSKSGTGLSTKRKGREENDEEDEEEINEALPSSLFGKNQMTNKLLNNLEINYL